MTLTDAALAYAAAGMAVLPLHRPITRPDGRTGCSCRDAKCRSIGKHPRTPHGLHDATAEPARVAAWWRRWPQANIGLATGARFDVLDVDGPVGLRALRRLAEGGLSLSGPLVRPGAAAGVADRRAGAGLRTAEHADRAAQLCTSGPDRRVH